MSKLPDRKIMLTENVRNAMENYKKAKEYCTRSLFRWRLNWEKASHYFNEALKYYEKCLPEYIKGYIDTAICCGEAYENNNDNYLAAKCYEKASTQSVNLFKSSHDSKNIIKARSEVEKVELMEIAELYKKASGLYRLGEASDQSINMLVSASKLLSEVDVDMAYKYLSDACQIYEDENRGMFCANTFNYAVQYMIKKERYREAIDLLYRQNKLYKDNIKTFEADLHKNMLSIIVLRIHLNDVKDANKDLEDFMSDQQSNFLSSKHAEVAEDLLMSYQESDEQKFKEICNLQIFTFLLNPVACLVRKLKVIAKPEEALDDPSKEKHEDKDKVVEQKIDDEPNLQ